jgi:hypothetical protein
MGDSVMTDEYHDEEIIRRLELLGGLKPAPEATRHALDRVRRTLSESTQPVSVPTSLQRRFFMRIVVPSTAALVLVGGAVLFFLTATPSPTLADVVKAAEKHKFVKYKVVQVADDWPVDKVTPQLAYADLKVPRYRVESRSEVPDLNGTILIENAGYFISDGKKNQGLGVSSVTIAAGQENNPAVDGYKKLGVPHKEATLMRLGKDNDDYPYFSKAKTILQLIHELEEHKNVTTTKDKVGDRGAIKYFLEDGKRTYQLWVDVETKLPLKFHFEVLVTNPPPEGARGAKERMILIYSDFEWDPKLPKGIKDLDSLFDLTPPKGFQLKDLTKDDLK